MSLQKIKKEILGDDDCCVIYGAGAAAYFLAKAILINEWATISCFVVSEKGDNVERLFGIPVLTLDDFVHREEFSNNRIIIATSAQFQQEILDALLQYDLKNLILLPDEYFLELRKAYPELTPEIDNTVRSNYRLLWGFQQQLNEERIQYIYSEGEYLNTYWDRRFYYDDFIRYRGQKEYYSHILELIKDLDPESTQNVFCIIDRLNKLCDGKTIHYRNEEKKHIRQVQGTFYSRIYQLTDTIYSWNGYFLPSNHFEEPVFCYEHGLPQLRNLQRLQKKSIIDAGAFIGDSAVVLSKYTDCTVYSFEGKKENYDVILNTAKLNGVSNIKPQFSVLSNYVGEIEMIISNEEMTTSTIDRKSPFNIEGISKTRVPCTTIDKFVEENGIEVGLIKTDVEGAEQQLLQGAEKTIRSQRPALSISMYHSINDFFEIKPWLEKLNVGYHFKVIRPIMQHSFMLETILLAEVD